MDNQKVPVITITIPIDILGTVGSDHAKLYNYLHDICANGVFDLSIERLEKVEKAIQEEIDNGKALVLLAERV